MTDQPIETSPDIWTPEADPERIDREAEYYPSSRGLALGTLFEDAQLTDRLMGWLEVQNSERFDRHRQYVFGPEVGAELTPEEANARYGVPGRLSFDRPVSERRASWQQTLARRQAFSEEVLANSDVGPLSALGAGLAGAMLDPAGLPLWLIPELGAGRAIRGAVAAGRLGRIGNVGRGALVGGGEGLAGGLAFEGVNLWMHHEGAQDYDFGQGSFNVLAGGLLGSGIGSVGGWFEGRGRPPRQPAAVAELGEDARLGAFAEAMEAVADDRPVDLGPMLQREAEMRASGRVAPEALAQLDETGMGDGALNARLLGEDVAVTPRGTEIPVRYALVEADDLVTSHDDDLFRNPEYPGDLQPRQRDRSGAIARNRLLETELNPRRLMSEAGAETGAPIVSRDGVVESGNGRTIAIRRSARTGSPAYGRYRAELERRGFDIEGMRAPVLVRVRSQSMDGAGRVRLTREMNAEATEAYSPSERAMTDAAQLDDDVLALVAGPDLKSAANRRFVTAFTARAAGDDLNRMTQADGALSTEGLERISAAVVARAYGDRGLVEALFEATDSNIKAIGKALAAAAPEWASLKAAIARGEVPAEVDPTPHLISAVAFVRHVRNRGQNMGEAMDLIIGQSDAFSGQAMTPETEAFVRSFFQTSKEGATLWRSPRGADSLAEGLRWLAGEARKVQPGPNLFGETADAATGKQLLDAFARWFAGQGDEQPPLRFDDPTNPAGGNVRPAGGAARREPGGQGAGEQAAAAEGVKPKVAKGEAPPPPKGEPFADPEIQALAADNEAIAARWGKTDVAPPAQDPQTLADAVAAAAFCLKGGGA